MKFSEFKVGNTFYYNDNAFVCVDIGIRLVCAVRKNILRRDDNVHAYTGSNAVV